MVQSYLRFSTSDTSSAREDRSEFTVMDSKLEDDYQLDSALTNDIVGFVCNSEITDFETQRRSINFQVDQFAVLSFHNIALRL